MTKNTDIYIFAKFIIQSHSNVLLFDFQNLMATRCMEMT